MEVGSVRNDISLLQFQHSYYIDKHPSSFSHHVLACRAGGGKIELVRPLTIMLKLLLYTCQ